MVRLTTRLVMGATLFATPGLKRGIQTSGLASILIVLVVALVPVLLFRDRGSRPGPSDPDPGDGWGKGPPRPDAPRPDQPKGGIPLDDARPADVRLRGRGRLADHRPPRARRPARDPDRTPVRRTTSVEP